MVSDVSFPASPAIDMTKGMVDITLLPSAERMHSATPNVMMKREITRRMCCQMKPVAFCRKLFESKTVVVLFIMNRLRLCNVRMSAFIVFPGGGAEGGVAGG